jgi:hypothetical protein
MQTIDLKILNPLYTIYNPYIPAFDLLAIAQKQKRKNEIIFHMIVLLKKICGIKFSI